MKECRSTKSAQESTAIPNESSVTISNPDNEYLGAWGGSEVVMGFVDEVNGPGATERREYVPTNHELLQLLEYWARVNLNICYFYFGRGEAGGYECRLEAFSRRRMQRILDLLPKEQGEQVLAKVRAFYWKDEVKKRWNIYQYGTPENQAEFMEKLGNDRRGQLHGWNRKVAVFIPPGETDLIACVERTLAPYNGNPVFLRVKSECCPACRQWLRSEWRGSYYYIWRIGGYYDGAITGRRQLSEDGCYRSTEAALPDNVCPVASLLDRLRSDPPVNLSLALPTALLHPIEGWLHPETSPNEKSGFLPDWTPDENWSRVAMEVLEKYPDWIVVGVDCGLR